VTHPFHPLLGRRFEIVDIQRNWHEPRVWFHDGKRLSTLPFGWTSLAPEDPFAVVSAGRAWFRPEDLLRLVELVDGLRGEASAAGGGSDV
jgi:hypothetical protein